MATDQAVPGSTGGSVHVLEVARGLVRRGHEVHAVVARAAGHPPREEQDGVVWHRVGWTPPWHFFRFRARPAVDALARELRPAAVMERYYNFGGEGIRTAARHGIPSLLEVNSPAVDHPGSIKGAVDGLLVLRPLRRYRESLCRQAAALVAPLPEIVPAFARAKTETVTWGANVDAFSPARRRDEVRSALGVPPGAVVVLFSGSFRPWHGVHVLEHLDEPGVCEVLLEARRTLGARGRLFVYTHAMESSSLAAFQRGVNRLAWRLGRAGLIDHEREALRKSDHRNAIRSHEHFEELCARAGLRVAERRYYNVVFKAVVEDLGLRLFEQWRRRKGAAPPAGPATATSVEARPPSAPLLALARALTWLLKLDVVLFGGVRTGPFFGLLVPRQRG